MKRLLLIVAAVASLAQVSAPPRVIVQDEGATQGTARTLNCTGAGIACTVTGSTATLNASGGGGGGNFLDVTIDFDTTIGDASWWFAPTTNLPDAVDTGPSEAIWISECGRFVGVRGAAVSPQGWVSYDGNFWAARTNPVANGWNDLAYAPSLSRVVTVGTNTGGGGQVVMTSDDCGLSWTGRTPPQANSWLSVAWSPSLPLFVAVSSGGVNRVMTSADGITWSTASAAEANSWSDVAWSPDLGLFAAVSSTGANRAMTSPDGSAWTARALSSASAWNSVTWAPSIGKFVAVAFENGANARAATSTDGTTWTTQTAPAGLWNDVTWAPELNLLVAVASATGDNRIMTSPDGVTWTARTPPTVTLGEGNTWGRVIWSAYLRKFVALGTGGDMIHSSAVAEGMVYTVTVTGQSWVSASSRILCTPFGSTTDGLTPETVFASGVQCVPSNRVVGTGFDLSVYTPHGATGTYRFHVTGS